MATLCRAAGIDCRVEDSPGRAVRLALGEGRPILVVGSLFTVGTAMRELGIHPADEPAGLGRPAAPVGGAAG